MERVVVGMSGGVDSSVAAYLLKQQGFEVIGLFMKNWEETDPNGVCTAEEDFADVRRVCQQLELPYYAVNFSKEYYDRVFEQFLAAYRAGRTPNPDVLCNREIKFGPFSDFAKKLGARFVATGHYARLVREGDRVLLYKAADQNKDQSYFLHQLTGEQLSMALFPLADLRKDEVRNIAAGLGLSTAAKKDSTGICFIGERKFRAFLQNFLPARPGDILEKGSGKKVGRHEGVMYYTLGQRKGLNIGGVSGGGQGRWFVVEEDVRNNILWVEQNEGEDLFRSELTMHGVNWIPAPPSERFACLAKTRYRQPDQQAEAALLPDGGVRVSFAVPQRAVTAGQYCVLYAPDGRVIGGGEID